MDMKIGRTDEGQIIDVSLRILRKGWSAIRYLHVKDIYTFNGLKEGFLVDTWTLLLLKHFKEYIRNTMISKAKLLCYDFCL